MWDDSPSFLTALSGELTAKFRQPLVPLNGRGSRVNGFPRISKQCHDLQH